MTDATLETGVARIEAAFAAAREEGRAALMPYMMGAFPTTETAAAVADAYAESGSDLIELGIPFSDPLADGPVIHAADTAALANGATFEKALEPCALVADRVPVVVMCYANMALAMGPKRFAGRIAEAGAAGAIIPDMPLEEGVEMKVELSAVGLALIPLVAPTTPPERRARIAEGAGGFIYTVSTVGTTGERTGEIGDDVRDFIADMKEKADVPVAVGFGISTPEQAAVFGEIADGVIIGSRLVRHVEEAGSPAAAAAAVSGYLGTVLAELSPH